MFLTDKEVRDLTRYELPKYQMKWLRDNGISFRVGADGHPIVLIKQVEAILGYSAAPERKRTQPNVEGLRKHLGLVV